MRQGMPRTFLSLSPLSLLPRPRLLALAAAALGFPTAPLSPVLASTRSLLAVAGLPLRYTRPFAVALPPTAALLFGVALWR